MDVGIVIVNYNTYENTFKCIDSILEVCKLEYKIFVIDNRSTNDSVKRINDRYRDNKKIDLITASENKGYSAGVNIGIKEAIKNKCNAIIISNNDIIYKQNSIEAMYEELEKNKSTAVVGPKIIDINDGIMPNLKGTLSYEKYIFSKKPLMYIDFMGINKKLYYKNYKYDKTIEVEGMVGGACFMISNEFIKKIGYLDENIFLFFEEDTIAYKLKDTDLKVYLQPESEVIHFGSSTINKQESSFALFHRYSSAMYVLKKYEKIGNFKLFLIFIINYMGLFLNFKDKTSRDYMNKLYKYYIQLLSI